MRRFDKKLNIKNANQLAEQRYITLKEEFMAENSASSMDLTNPSNTDAFKSLLHRVIFENVDYFNFNKIGDKATANDNMVFFTTKMLPGFFKSPQVNINYRGSSFEIWTNNPELMKEYLQMMGQDPSKYTFWDSQDNQIG
jgi:hypothetical protein